MTQIYPRSYLCHLRHFAFRSGKRSEFYGLHLTRNHRQMHRTVAFYIHLLVSGLHHHFSVQSHYSPLAGVFLVSAIIAPRRQNLPVFGRHNDTFPSFKPHFIPIRKGNASLISSNLFSLFCSSSCNCFR